MIDVVFLLLVFFVWTSSFDPPELDLPSEVAMQETTAANGASFSPPDQAPRPIDEMVIEIQVDDQQIVWQIGPTRYVTEQKLLDRLKEIAALGVQPPVVLDPADAVPMATAIATLDAARLAGFSTVVFAIDR